MIDAMMMVVDSVHHNVAQRLAGLTERQGNDGKWEFPTVSTALEVIVMWPMWEYVRRRQSAIAEYVSVHPIFELRTRSDGRKLSSRFLSWWDQDHGQAEEGVE